VGALSVQLKHCTYLRITADFLRKIIGGGGAAAVNVHVQGFLLGMGGSRRTQKSYRKHAFGCDTHLVLRWFNAVIAAKM